MSSELYLRIRLWLEDTQDFALGPGRVELLYKIGEMGSLNQAAKAMGMSYRRAWGQMKKLEESLGVALLEKGGSNKGGFELTDFARELVGAYDAWQQEVREYAFARSRELFPKSVRIRAGEPSEVVPPKRGKRKRS